MKVRTITLKKPKPKSKKLKACNKPVPHLFRAIDKRDEDRQSYYGQTIGVTEYKVVCFAVHCGEETVFKERILLKSEYNFIPLDKESFRLQVSRGLYNMRKEFEEKRMEFEAADYRFQEASERLTAIVEAKP